MLKDQPPQGRKSGTGDREEVVVMLSEGAGWSIRGQKVTEGEEEQGQGRRGL